MSKRIGRRASAPDGGRLPLLARAADALIVALILAAAAVGLSGGFVARPWGWRLSVTSPWRALAWAAALVVLRHAWIRRPTLWQRLASSLLVDAGESLAHPARPGAAMHAAVIAGFFALACAALFQQVASPRSVADLGDPLFSMWRLDWVAYQLIRDPLHLFDANIFHPEPRTLAYSDAMLVAALAAAPWLWLGADVVVVHNVLMVAATALSGVTMFWLVRSLVGSTEAASVAGAVFALYPLRWAFYANLELEITLWMPLALLWLHRTLAGGRWRDGLATGLAVGLQALSSLYYGLFLSVHMAVVALSLVIARRARGLRRAVPPLTAGAVLAVLLVAPATVPYFKNRSTVGERSLAHAAQFSARPRDYLAAHPTSRAYAQTLPGKGKLELFPGVAPVALAAAGVWPPMTPIVLAHAAALGVSADASLGTNGRIYPALYRIAFPFRGLRAPDRFSVLVGFGLAVLTGFGVAWILRHVQTTRSRRLVTAALVALVTVESAPALKLVPVWDEVPSIYDSLPADGEVVLVDLPFPQRDGSTEGEYSFLYFATHHHHRLVNGGSGFYPPWYDRLADVMLRFPNDAAMAELKRHGAEYLVVHGYFYGPDAYRSVTASLDARDDVTLIAARPWNGVESRLYRVIK